jgi:hypothetical protein
MTLDRCHLDCKQFGILLVLSSNDRVSSFYWIRGSKVGFLTSFSYLNHYFRILGFLQSHYLLFSLCFSCLHKNPISCPVFSYHCNSEVLRHLCAPIFLAHIMLFLKGRHSREPAGSRLITNFLSHFCLLPKVFYANIHWAISYHTLLTHKNPQILTFLHDISLR